MEDLSYLPGDRMAEMSFRLSTGTQSLDEIYDGHREKRRKLESHGVDRDHIQCCGDRGNPSNFGKFYLPPKTKMYLHDISKIVESTPVSQDGAIGDPQSLIRYLTDEV